MGTDNFLTLYLRVSWGGPSGGAAPQRPGRQLSKKEEGNFPSTICSSCTNCPEWIQRCAAPRGCHSHPPRGMLWGLTLPVPATLRGRGLPRPPRGRRRRRTLPSSCRLRLQRERGTRTRRMRQTPLRRRPRHWRKERQQLLLNLVLPKRRPRCRHRGRRHIQLNLKSLRLPSQRGWCGRGGRWGCGGGGP